MNETHQDPLVADGHGEKSARSERLVDYLYDELSAEARAAFEDELAADPGLAAELAALRGARASFVSLPVEPMPRGLLDDVLAQADAQAATFAKASAQRGAGSPSFFERALEGLRRLVFQPAFAMGMVLVLVAGVAMVATRNPNEIAGMEVARDVPRIPPVAMAPAEAAPAPAAAPLAQAAPAEPVAPSPDPEAEAALADLAVGSAEPVPALEKQMAMKAAEREESKDAAPARFVEARAKGDFDDLSRPEQPRAARPVTASDSTKSKMDELAALDAAASNDGGAWAAPGLGDSTRGAATGGASEGTVATGASGNKTTAAPAVAEPSAAGSRNAPKAEAPPAPDAERARAETVREYEDRADKKASRDTPTELAKVPAREAAPARKAGIDDEAREVPTAPPLPTNKPTEPAPSGERIYTTLKQQLAAGALADAEKSLAELARLEGETTRVKQAREALARAKAAGQSGVTRPADTKPLPEPSKTPR